MKILIKYSDSLLLERGEIRPEIGDKIVVNSAARGNKKLQHYIVTEVVKGKRYGSKYNYFIRYSRSQRIIEECYVEIDYKPNEALEFANLLSNEMLNCSLYHREGLWKYLNDGELLTTENLYKKFKQEENEK